jgi:hypothetical protein
MAYDYSDAPPPRDVELIPHNTLATVQMRIRPGNAGENEDRSRRPPSRMSGNGEPPPPPSRLRARW